MKKTYALLALLWLTAVTALAQPRISIFFDHVAEMARQEKITVREAAQRVRQMGYEGIDVRVGMSDAELQMLDSLGFQNASAIADINFVKGEQPEATRQALDFMRRHGYKRLLIIPGLLPENATPKLMDQVGARINAFVKTAAKEGIDVMVEDYDNPRSPCYNTQTLDRLFAAAPQLNHVFDTGNYLFCGEDVMTTLRHFRGRIHHVHLKDRKAQRDYASLPIGTGVMPLKEVVNTLLASGYDGWFTVEHFGAPSQLEFARQSIANVRAAWDVMDNPVISAIMARRSIRKYRDKPVEHEKLEAVVRCGINAPSGMNRQPWIVRVVEDQKLIADVTAIYKKENAEQVARDKDFKNMFRNAPNLICVCTPTNGGDLDAGLLGENIMLAAQSLGLGTCCLGGPVRFLLSNEQCKFFLDRLDIPDGYSLNYIIAIGYPDEQPDARPRDNTKVKYIQ